MRDVAEYGNPDGPTFEVLVQKWCEAALEEDTIYVAFIEGAQRTDTVVSKNLKF